MFSKMMNSRNMNSLKTRMLSRAGGNPVGISARQFSQVIGGQEGSTVSYSCLNLFRVCRGPHLLAITPSSTTSTTPSSLALVVQVSELLSVSPKLASRQLVSPSSSQQGLTPLLLRVVSTQPSATCIMTIGDGISMTPSKAVIGSEIRMPFSI